MSPVAEAPRKETNLVSTPDASTLFMARRSDLRLVKRAITAIRGPEGEVRDQTLGETLAFHDGVLRVPEKGEVTLTNGERVDAGEVREWLLRHRLLGDWQEGFWRVDPTAPPISPAELDTLQGLAIELDADGLRAFIEQEKAGWGREELIAGAASTLEKVQAKTAEIAAEREAAVAAALKKKEG